MAKENGFWYDPSVRKTTDDDVYYHILKDSQFMPGDVNYFGKQKQSAGHRAFGFGVPFGNGCDEKPSAAAAIASVYTVAWPKYVGKNKHAPRRLIC